MHLLRPVALVAVLLLTGCGGADGGSGDGEPTRPTSTSSGTDTAVETDGSVDPTSLGEGKCSVDAELGGPVGVTWVGVPGTVGATGEDGSPEYRAEKDGVSIVVTVFDEVSVTTPDEVFDVPDPDIDIDVASEGTGASVEGVVFAAGLSARLDVMLRFTCRGQAVEPVLGDGAGAFSTPPAATRQQRAVDAVSTMIRAYETGDCDLFYSVVGTDPDSRDAFEERQRDDRQDCSLGKVDPDFRYGEVVGEPTPATDGDVLVLDPDAVDVAYTYTDEDGPGTGSERVFEVDGRAYVFLSGF